MPGEVKADQLGPVDIPPAVRRKAALYVASKANTLVERTEFLAMLGLLPAHHPAMIRDVDHGMPGYKLGCRCPKCRQANRNRLARQRARKGARR